MRTHSGRPIARILAALSIPLMLGGCHEGVLDPQGPVGRAEKVILYDATAIMLAVIVPVMILTLLFAWWYRSGNRRAKYRPDWDYSGRIEVIVWSIPALIIMFLGGVAWISSHQLEPSEPLDGGAPVEVEVVSLDWRWLFIYPKEGVASLNALTVPFGVPVHFRLTSTSVMNSFFVPQLGSQIYTMPRMTTQLNLLADRPGTYQGLSAQFSGEGFSDMRFDLTAVTQEAYRAWVDATRAHGGNLDYRTFTELAQPAKATGVQTYGAVAAGVFDAVAMGHLTAEMAPKEP